MFRHFFSVFFIFSFFSCVFGQGDSLSTENYIRIGYENDLFDHSDRYFTQGIQLQFIHSAFRFSPVTRIMPRLRSARNYFGLQLEQDCYTPKDITFQGIDDGERPFAGVILLSHTLNSLDAGRRRSVSTQVDLGAVGPCAKCEEEQTGIHKLVDSPRPLGWEYQIKNELVINYNLRYEKAIMYTRYAELIGNAGARLGNLYTDAQVGLHLRAGFLQPYFNNLGLGQRSKNRKFQCYLEGKAQVRFVGYNQTLQGGWFSDSPYTLSDRNLERAVLLTHFGLTIAYKRISVKYSKSFISKEFSSSLQHGWGGIEIRMAI